MTDPLHIVCPHCHTTNRVRQADLAQALGARFQIRSIPTLALSANGREVARQPGHHAPLAALAVDLEQRGGRQQAGGGSRRFPARDDLSGARAPRTRSMDPSASGSAERFEELGRTAC